MSVMTRCLSLLLACALALLALVETARAQDCNFSASDINFGSVDTLSSGNSDTFGEITISCPGLLSSVSGTIGIGDGSGGATVSARQMTSAGSSTSLDYQLYSDSSRTSVLGTSPGDSLSFDSSLINILGSSATLIIYSRVFGGQSDIAPGSYLSQFGSIDVIVNYTTCTALLICTDRTATFSFNVTADVAANCKVSATNLDFGATGVLVENVDGTSTINVLCTPETPFQIGLDNGLTGSSPTGRLMTNLNGYSISYGLYRDPSHTQSWGNTVDIDTETGNGSGMGADFSVYGRVPPQVTPPVGVYSDTVVVTLSY